MSVRAAALTKIEIKPGIVADDTALASEGAYIAGQWVRFRRGRAEVIKGYNFLTTDTFEGICRGAHTWSDLSGGPVLAFGTHTKLYGYLGGVEDITPLQSEGWLKDPFSTKNGSNVVTVRWNVYDPDAGTETLVPHNLQVGDALSFDHAATVGGLTLNGATVVTSVVDSNTLTITAGGNASSDVTNGGGANVTWTAALPEGRQDGLGGLGYGVGTYGDGDYGVSSTIEYLSRVWSLDNFGENLLANPRDQGIYEWQPTLTNSELVTETWQLGTGWNYGTGTLTAVAGTSSNASQDASEGVLQGGKQYRVSFTLTRTAGSVKFRVDSINLSPDLTVPGNYTFLFESPSDALLWSFNKDNAFAGTISNISIKVANIAYRIDEAPPRVHSMFVDPVGIVFALGCHEVDGDYNPMAVRWSDRGNNRSWIPDTDRLAGETVLSAGGRLVGGLPTRQQNLIWSDAALFSAIFTGDATAPYTFKLMGRGCGLLGRNAVTEHNGIAFWMSNTKNFYIFQGAVPQVIDCPVRDEVFDHIDQAQAEKVYSWVNAENSEVWWLYPDSRDGLECSRYVAFNWIENTWILGMLSRTAGVASGVFANPILFSPDGHIYEHETGDTFAGGAVTWSIETAFFDIEDGSNLMTLSGYQPDFKNLQGNLTLTIYGRNSANGSVLTFGPYAITSATEFVWFSCMARQIKMVFSGVGTPASGRFGSQLFYVQKSGVRR